MEIYQNSKKGGRKQGHESEACTLPAQSGGGGGGMIWKYRRRIIVPAKYKNIPWETNQGETKRIYTRAYKNFQKKLGIGEHWLLNKKFHFFWLAIVDVD